MNAQTRMSPMTAFFIGLFGFGAVGIASGTAIVLFSLSVIDSRTSEILGFTETTIGETLENLPELIDSLPGIVQELLNDRRAPEYIENIEVDVAFRRDDRIGGLRPVMTIVNRGSEVVSLLAIRVAAMDADRIPLQEWTEIVATPLAIEGEWRGPLMPGATRNVVLSRCLRSIDPADASSVTGAVEIADVRLWKPTEREPI